jgi:hypothetical protein
MLIESHSITILYQHDTIGVMLIESHLVHFREERHTSRIVDPLLGGDKRSIVF